MSFHLIGTNGFHIKAENGRFFVVGRVVVRTSNLKISRHTTTKNCAKKHAARAARLFFLIQPIKSLIFAVTRTPEICIFNEKKQEFCTLCTLPMFVFYFDDISLPFLIGQ